MKHLYYGDNLKVLRESIAAESVDLIYLDPPFNSQADYNVIFRDQTGQESSAQILAFKDTWHWGTESEQAIENLLLHHGELAQFLTDTVRRLGRNSLSAYLVMMAARLVELRRVLKPTGSLYLHCDPTASHYLKTVLDVLFGPQNFRNEIIWKRTAAHSDARLRFAAVSDTILFYSKSSEFTFNRLHTGYSAEMLKRFSRDDKDGRGPYDLENMTAPESGGMAALNKATGKPNGWYEWQGFPPPARGWRYKRETMQKLHDEGKIYYPCLKTGEHDFSKRPRVKKYLSQQEGPAVSNIWDDISPVNSQAMERMSYPTQKPVALLERVVKASSNPGDVVLDPFCGCGTTICAAQQLNRQWVGIDITHLSVSLIKARLKRDFDLVVGKDYQEVGTPRDVVAAKYFAETDPFQFQFWVVGEIGAQPYGAVGDSKQGKKGGDTGIDGQLYFRTPDGSKIERVIVSVKAGKNLNPAMVRDLHGTVEREKAAVGVLLLAHTPTKGMLQEAAKAGAYTWGGRTFPKLQILTVEQLLAGEQPLLPRGVVNVSYEHKEAKSLIGKGSKDKGAAPLFGN